MSLYGKLPPPPPGQCKHRFYAQRRYCRRSATKDGFCGVHHPDAEKARREKSDQRAAALRASWAFKDKIHSAEIELREAAIASANWRNESGYAYLSERLNKAVLEYRKLTGGE